MIKILNDVILDIYLTIKTADLFSKKVSTNVTDWTLLLFLIKNYDKIKCAPSYGQGK